MVRTQKTPDPVEQYRLRYLHPDEYAHSVPPPRSACNTGWRKLFGPLLGTAQRNGNSVDILKVHDSSADNRRVHNNLSDPEKRRRNDLSSDHRPRSVQSVSSVRMSFPNPFVSR